MKSLCERMAGQFSFGKTEVCMCMIFLPKEDCTVIPQLHICFASNTLARVVAEITSAFYRHDSQPKLDMPKQGIEYAGTIPVGCSLYHSWDHGPDSFTILWKGLRASWHLLLPFLSRRLRDQLSTSPFSFFFCWDLDMFLTTYTPEMLETLIFFHYLVKNLSYCEGRVN